ncbi:hypothetical protein DM02DRAFT_631387 [Periconia macrospinosa]|uniref:F-box domain-containing protein n=1 Tax=Periconia macrospinosa TaxID=97972 RepID=A0A2V1DJ29_9PLEO|nr:hypothetical protein DM02DRAFT_631387 [Periconia macrospinosa]
MEPGRDGSDITPPLSVGIPELDKLPIELIIKICGYLSGSDLCSARLTCRRLAAPGMDVAVRRNPDNGGSPIGKDEAIDLHCSLEIHELSVINTLLTNESVTTRLHKVKIFCVPSTGYEMEKEEAESEEHDENLHIDEMEEEAENDENDENLHLDEMEEEAENDENDENLHLDQIEKLFDRYKDEPMPIVVRLSETLKLLSNMPNVILEFGCTYRKGSATGIPFMLQKRIKRHMTTEQEDVDMEETEHEDSGTTTSESSVSIPCFGPDPSLTLDWALFIFITALNDVDYSHKNVQFVLSGCYSTQYIEGDRQLYSKYQDKWRELHDVTLDCLSHIREGIMTLKSELLRSRIPWSYDMSTKLGRIMRSIEWKFQGWNRWMSDHCVRHDSLRFSIIVQLLYEAAQMSEDVPFRVDHPPHIIEMVYLPYTNIRHLELCDVHFNHHLIAEFLKSVTELTHLEIKRVWQERQGWREVMDYFKTQVGNAELSVWPFLSYLHLEMLSERYALDKTDKRQTEQTLNFTNKLILDSKEKLKREIPRIEKRMRLVHMPGDGIIPEHLLWDVGDEEELNCHVVEFVDDGERGVEEVEC